MYILNLDFVYSGLLLAPMILQIANLQIDLVTENDPQKRLATSHIRPSSNRSATIDRQVATTKRMQCPLDAEPRSIRSVRVQERILHS